MSKKNLRKNISLLGTKVKSQGYVGVAALLAVVFLLVGGFWFLWPKARHADERKPIPVEVAKATLGPVARFVKLSGVFRAVNSATLHPEVEGRVAKILFQQGSRVEKGDILVQLDDRSLRAQVNEARAKLRVAKEEERRAQQLFQKSFAPQALVDKNNAQLQVARANLEIAEANLEKTRVRAPFDGVIGLQKVSEGATVGRSDELATVVASDPLYIDFSVSDSLSSSLNVGDAVDVMVKGWNALPLEGKIIAIDPYADPTAHAIQARAELPNTDMSIRPGEFAQVTLSLGAEEKAVLIPMSAVETAEERSSVFIVSNNIAVQQDVTLGVRQGNMVQVKAGVRPGDLVVISGRNRLFDGMPVVVMLPDQAEEFKS
jgi:membrane fusion protein (multidrug efflux system)